MRARWRADSHTLAAAFGVCGALGASTTACSSTPAASPDAGGVTLPALAADAGLSGANAEQLQLLVSQCNAADGGLTVAFDPMYSAFDGVHRFQLPSVVQGSNANVTWSVDSTMVEMQTDPERPNEVLLTMQASGNTLVYVQSADGKCGSARLIISPATSAEWMIGEARYNDGKALVLNGAAGGTGSPLEQEGGTGGPACNNCHGPLATSEPYVDVSHTPEQTGGFSDQDLLGIILHGQFPQGAYFDTAIVSPMVWHSFHQWSDISMPAQQQGIITYLRSLTPEPQMGAPDFGNAIHFPDAGTTTPDAGDAGDAGTVAQDAAGTDAATLDATGVDSSFTDASFMDASLADANVVEASVVDATTADANGDDAGAADQ